MATTSSNLVAGKAISGQGGNGNNGRCGLKATLATSAAILGCAAALMFGGPQGGEAMALQPQPIAQAAQRAANLSTSDEFRWSLGGNASVPAPACIYADAAGVPGEGCGITPPASDSPTMKAEAGCVYADAFGVPGEGCGTAETETATKLPELWNVPA